MRQLYYNGFMLYIWGEPVPGYAWNVWYGSNSGAYIGMDDYGIVVGFSRVNKPYGME